MLQKATQCQAGAYRPQLKWAMQAGKKSQKVSFKSVFHQHHLPSDTLWGQEKLWTSRKTYSKELPGIANSFPFEIVSKRPVAQHLKEGVVVHIFADIIQVIMLATRTYTLQLTTPTVGLAPAILPHAKHTDRLPMLTYHS